MTHWVQTDAAKPDNLTSTAGATWKKEKLTPESSLTSVCIQWCMHTQ